MSLKAVNIYLLSILALFLSGCFPVVEIVDGHLEINDYKDSQYNLQVNPELCEPCDKCRMGVYLLVGIQYQQSIGECNRVYGWPRDYSNPFEVESDNEDFRESCREEYSGNIVYDYYYHKWYNMYYTFYFIECQTKNEFCCDEDGGHKNGPML